MRYLEAPARGPVKLPLSFRGGIPRLHLVPLGTTEEKAKKPNRIFAIRLFKKLPRRCRLGGSPVPFGNGRMTVARASDFQLRRAMFPKTRPSLLGSEVSVRDSHLYLEQRRVKH
jgi:hypothetical protein